MLAPKGEWGERVTQAFRRRWEALGGRVLETQRYAPEGRDYNATLRRLLNIDEAQDRAQRLQERIKRPVKSASRSRQDADLIFLAAPQPQQARQVGPLMRYFSASQIPVYATSHIYSGRPEPSADRDLDGMVFCDMPWVLKPEAEDVAPLRQALAQTSSTSDAYTRLHALGVDAYGLIEKWGALTAASSHATAAPTHAGKSGRLQMDEDRRVQRELLCARFVDGIPSLL